MSAAALTEQQRRLANVIRVGVVESVQYPKVRVRFGEIVTAWLPMAGQRAGGIRVWNPLTVGEQVVVMSPSGDLAQGLVYPGIYSDANAAPGDAAGLFKVIFPDGATLEYDADGGGLSFESQKPVKIKSPSIELEADAITIKGPVSQTGGDITSDSDVVASGIHLKTHVHGGVQSGGSSTMPPTP